MADWLDVFNERISSLDQDGINEYFENLQKKWKLPKGGVSKVTEFVLKNFEIASLSDTDFDIINKSKCKCLWEITEVYYKYSKYNNITLSESRVKWEKIFETFYYSFNFIKNAYLLERMSLDNYEPDLNEDTSTLFKFSFINYEKTTSYQNLLLYLLQCFNDNDYARYNDNLYSKVFTPNGDFTHVWKFEKKIKSFILDSCQKELNFEQWCNLTASGNNNLKSAEQYLIEYNGPEILSIEKDRHVFSFNNGIWITKYNRGTEEEPIWSDIFIKYEDIYQNSKLVNKNTFSSKYFNSDFNNYDNLEQDEWFSIINDCPVFKSILDYQKFKTDIQSFLCVFIGRNLYDICEMESWCVIMYLLGQAGAGKSTIIAKVIGKFYEEEDIKSLSNNVEKQFGVKPLADAKIVLAEEIKENFRLEQTEWQLMAEGGKSTFAEKNKNAETITWKAPVPMAGNSIPNYKNNCGQFSRRLVIWKFWRKVNDTDTRLGEKLLKELPIIMKLCCCGYLNAVNKYKELGVWKFLPKYFKENQEEMDENTNTLISFLKSSNVILSDKVYIPEKIFKQYFNDYCRENNLLKTQFNSDFYSGPFSNNSIKVSKRTRKKYPINSDNWVVGTFFEGVDIVHDQEQDDDDYVEPS